MKRLKQNYLEMFSANGFRPDRFGHYKKTTPDGKEYRLKIGKKTVRREIKTVFDNCSIPHSWTRLETYLLPKGEL